MNFLGSADIVNIYKYLKYVQTIARIITQGDGGTHDLSIKHFSINLS